MSRLPSWAVSDAFWQRVEPHLPQPTRDPNKSYSRKKGGGRKPLDYRKVFEGIVYVLRTGCQSPKRYMAVPVPFMPTFASGKRPGHFWPCGEPGWRNMMKWKAFVGYGRVLIVP